MTNITIQMMQKLWPHGNDRVPGLIEGIVSSAPTVFQKYGLNSILTVAHFLAQASHECGAGLEMVENINYTAERACQVWPSQFRTPADVYRIVGSSQTDPQFHVKLMDNVYGNRMGNRPGTHDGSTFIGRGLSQVTGREGYEKLAAKTGLDLLDHPELLSDPAYALECGVADFVLCGCLPYAEADNIVGVTQKLNGGQIGIDQRRLWLTRWKTALAATPADAPILHPKKVTAAAAAGAAAGAAAHQAGFPVWAVALAVVGIAAIGYLVAHFIINKGK